MSQIMIQDLGFTYEGDYTPVFEGLDLQLDTNWRLGLVGRNGRGKTTLLRLLEGELEGVGQIILPGRCRRYPKSVLHMDLPTRQVLLDGMEDVDEWRLIREFSRLRFFHIAPIIAQEKIDVNRVEKAPSLHLD